MFTAPVLSRRLAPIARWLRPWACRSRSTSRIFRIDNLSPGILAPRRSAKEPAYLWLKTVGSTGPR